MEFRIGHGYDLHRLVEGRPLILGGVRIPFFKGLQGHSDADVLLHSITDALLGALALGDIGTHFPDSDPEWESADSADLLRVSLQMLHRRGWIVGNIDSVVIAERPKLMPYIPDIRSSIAELVERDLSSVSVKATTHEGVDATGRGEAIVAQSVVLLSKK